MRLRWISIRKAKQAVTLWHRHLDAPQGAIVAIAAWDAGRLVGVAMIGRPPARRDDDGETAEVIRVATDGTPNACSFLYSRAKRLAQAMGFVTVKTKTLPEESGASLRAVGAVFTGESRGGSWDRVNRRRQDSAPTCPKLRWEL